MALIKYLGAKERATNHLTGKAVVWEGNGDIQNVDDDVALTLVATFPEYYELATTSKGFQPRTTKKPTPSKKPADSEDEDEMATRPGLVNLDAMDEDQLRAFAQSNFGHDFHHSMKAPRMRDEIIALTNRG